MAIADGFWTNYKHSLYLLTYLLTSAGHGLCVDYCGVWSDCVVSYPALANVFVKY